MIINLMNMHNEPTAYTSIIEVFHLPINVARDSDIEQDMLDIRQQLAATANVPNLTITTSGCYWPYSIDGVGSSYTYTTGSWTFCRHEIQPES